MLWEISPVKIFVYKIFVLNNFRHFSAPSKKNFSLEPKSRSGSGHKKEMCELSCFQMAETFMGKCCGREGTIAVEYSQCREARVSA